MPDRRARLLTLVTLVLAAGAATYAIARTAGGGGGAARATRSAPPRPLGVGGTWRLTFDEEFSSGRLDTRRWQPNWLGARNTTVTASPNSSDINCVMARQATVRRGVLALTTSRRPCRASNGITYRYASGLVTTRRSFHFTYGFLQARVYIPGRAGRPVNFPAFWADGLGRWPTTGELDVMEVLGSCGPGLGYHFHSPAGAPGGCAAIRRPTGWHTFGADWQPGVVTYYYDGRRVGRISSGITGAPMYLILDNSVDPSLGGPNATGASMLVDYVRVWQRP